MSKTHDLFQEHFELRGASDRAFGLTLGGVSTAMGLYLAVFGAPGRGWLAVCLIAAGVTLAALGWFAAGRLAPLNRLWTGLGMLLFAVTGRLVALAIFGLAVVPIGVVMRAAGYDPLRLRTDPASESYWIGRRPPGPAPGTMTEQF